MDTTQTPPSDLYAAAHFYASRGWPVLPLYPMRDGVCACPDEYKQDKRCAPAKHPIGDLAPHAHLNATTDPAVVSTWWTLWPDANIGIALGPAGLIDVAPDSVEWWAEFTARGMPPTVHFASGGGEGHEHWLYRRDELPSLRIARPGQFDILSDGYACVPPNVHESGKPYRWLEWVELVDRPDWLAQTVLEHVTTRTAVDVELEPADTDEPPVTLTAEQLEIWRGERRASDRSNSLVGIARMLAAAGYTDIEGIARILAERDISLGWFKYSNRRGAHRSKEYLNIAAKYGKPEPKIRLSGARASVSSADVEGRTLYAVPEFPERVLPEPLRALAVATSLPTAMVAGAGLAVLAIATGGQTELVLDETQRERAIVWTALLGRNGIGKSPSMGLAFKPLVELDDAAYAQYRDDMAAWLALDDAGRKAQRRPVDPTILRDNLSGASLLRQLSQVSDTGLKLDELSTTLRRMQSGRDGQALIDPGQMLKMWSGEGVRYTRVGGGARGGGNEVDLYVPRPTVSLCGDLQTFLHALLGSDTDGMRVRWLPHQWEESWRAARRYPSADVYRAWAVLVERLYQRRPTTRAWHLERRERKLVDELVIDWGTRAESAEQATYQAALLKADRQMLKVALILAEAEARSVAGALYVEAKHLQDAAAWVEYCLQVWLSLGDAETLSISRESQALDPAVERIRMYIEQQGEIDPATGRRFITAKRLLKNAVAGVRMSTLATARSGGTKRSTRAVSSDEHRPAAAPHRSFCGRRSGTAGSCRAPFSTRRPTQLTRRPTRRPTQLTRDRPCDRPN